ncbi:MAG: hypothetical protein ACJ0J6_03285 [Dehalococcoidia bacterium]|tara:strand:- start:26 stop:247 length:222 start_codon:yes stop_codon:yes gene_type:complete
MLNKKILLLLIFILITIIVWYFSSPAKMIQIKNVNDYNSILSQDIIDEQNNVTSIGQLANDKKTVFILLRHFG